MSYEPIGGHGKSELFKSITRRDWLAGLAMQGIVGGNPKHLTKIEGSSFVEAAAELAYQAADAMIKEGSK